MNDLVDTPKILMVDDKPENLIVLEKILKDLPVSLYKTTSGEHALQLTLEHDFMLVLLDVQMPIMDGYQVLEMLSWDEKTRAIPVIFITANYADEQHKLKGYQYGAVDYLYKPINAEVLLSKVKVFLELYAQRRKYQALQRRYESILNSAGEGIIEIDLDGNFTYLNPAAEKLLSRKIFELVGFPLLSILQPSEENEPDDWATHPINLCCQEGNIYHKDEAELARKDHGYLPIEYTATPLQDEAGNYRGVVIVFNDITLRKTVEEQLTNLALYDHLTKLPNRLLFEKTIATTIARARRNGKEMALMFLDLDHFKNINDTLGHDVGDLLLKGVAERLQKCVRQSDTVARLGGDEFAIILDEVTKAEDAGLVAEKIINALIPSFNLNENEVFASTSIGIAIYPASGDTSIALTKNADIAMYEAKQEGRNNYRYFTATMNAVVTHKLELIHHLRYAIEKNELFLAYQPKLNLRTRKISGVEALLRWKHPTLGILPPNEFIPLAEETGLIQSIGAWTMQAACTQCKLWVDKQLPIPRIAINLSSTQLMQNDLIGIVKEALRQSNLTPSYLEIEITETSLVTNKEMSTQLLNELHNLGVHISIDDFGTGYSSLNYLKRLPVDSLKIDQTFVQDISTDPNDEAIVKAVIALAHTLDLNVIAEGVETEAQLDFLEKNQCDEIQGYYFSKPLAPSDIVDFALKQTESTGIK